MNPEITSDAHENHRRRSNAENFKASFSSPLSKIDFPMTGAQVFARVCKAEGLAGLFTSPEVMTLSMHWQKKEYPAGVVDTKGQWRMLPMASFVFPVSNVIITELDCLFILTGNIT